MKRLLVIALLVAACTGEASRSEPTDSVPTAELTPRPSYSNAPVQTKRPSTKPTAYPNGWLRATCDAVGFLGNATTYTDDLRQGLILDDYYALSQTGTYIMGEAFDADEAIDKMPRWAKADKLYDRLRTTAAEFQIAGGALKEGGENYSVSYIETGVRRFASAVDLMTATSRMFSSLADSYDFDCRGS